MIVVPGGFRYLAKWPEFRLSNFPLKGILNKQIPGCGFTEYCINGPENVILCSPRKMLLSNKWNQHKGDVYLVVNEMDKDPQVDKDISKIQVQRGNSQKKVIEDDEELGEGYDVPADNSTVYERISKEIREYCEKCSFAGKPIKILVTYDSYRIVKDILELELGLFKYFYTVVDEFQSILHDSRFKSSTEISFLGHLKQSHSALFVSATPMMDEYLEMLSEFKDLPYFELDWASEDPGRVVQPSLKVLSMKSVGGKAEEIIGELLRGNYEKTVVIRDGQPIEIVSDEIVLYVNSVNHIVRIIKKMKLIPEQVNILCSNTPGNLKKIQKKLGKRWNIGEVPMRGEKPKSITFCTRTVYLGADFYSLCARSYIFSDSNVDSLAVDISEDLPQILGRQRLDENPWSNSATFYYKITADYRTMKAEDFEERIKEKKDYTNNLLSAYNGSAENKVKYSLAKNYLENTVAYNYKSNYVAVNRIINSVTGDKILVPVLNNLVLVNELRAFKIQQIDYKDRFTVFSTIHNTISPDDIDNASVVEFLGIYNSLSTFYEKLRLLCEYDLSENAVRAVLGQIADSDEIKSFYLALGPTRLKALGYNATKIRKELGIVVFSEELLMNSIYSEFKVGDTVTLSAAKERLGNIYKSISYSATPKAKDLERFFEVKDVMLQVQIDGTKKRIRAYELLKKKPQK